MSHGGHGISRRPLQRQVPRQVQHHHVHQPLQHHRLAHEQAQQQAQDQAQQQAQDQARQQAHHHVHQPLQQQTQQQAQKQAQDQVQQKQAQDQVHHCQPASLVPCSESNDLEAECDVEYEIDVSMTTFPATFSATSLIHEAHPVPSEPAELASRNDPSQVHKVQGRRRSEDTILPAKESRLDNEIMVDNEIMAERNLERRPERRPKQKKPDDKRERHWPHRKRRNTE
jgi:hypothetical protein